MSIPQEMTAIGISEPGGPEVLKPVRLPVPAPRDGEVLIRVAGAGLNAPDLDQRRGSYPPPPGASPLPGLEVSGEIVARGTEATDFAIGDKVVALTNGGGYAEYVAVPAGQVLPLPSNWSLIAGAALPETFFTVEQTLVMRSGLQAGMTVLIHGAAGGIGGAAIQLSRLHGATPVAVVSSEDKAAYTLELGASAVIRRDHEDFVERVHLLTGGKGADRIVDIVGGGTLDRNISASARHGHIVLVSTLAGPTAQINAGRLMMKQLTLSGSTLRPQPPEVKAAIASSLRVSAWPALADGRIRPPRLRAFRLEGAPAAHAALEQTGSYGKIVLVTTWGSERPDIGDIAIESG